MELIKIGTLVNGIEAIKNIPQLIKCLRLALPCRRIVYHKGIAIVSPPPSICTAYILLWATSLFFEADENPLYLESGRRHAINMLTLYSICYNIILREE